MTFKQKRLYKKRAKRLMIAAYCTLPLFVFMIIFCVWWREKFNQNPFGIFNIIGKDFDLYVFIVTFVSIPFAGLFLASYSSFNRTYRIQYFKKIKEWRNKNFFKITFNLIKMGKLIEAIPYYNSIERGEEMRDYLFGILSWEFSKSIDENLKKQGEEKQKEVLEAFDPIKVKLS